MPFDEDDADRTRRRALISGDNHGVPFNLQPEDNTKLIVPHLHFDHAGGLHLFPNATLYMQAAETAYAICPCMCQDVLRAPFTGAHICKTVTRLDAGKLVFF